MSSTLISLKPAALQRASIASGVPNTAAASATFRPNTSSAKRRTMSVRGIMGTCKIKALTVRRMKEVSTGMQQVNDAVASHDV